MLRTNQLLLASEHFPLLTALAKAQHRIKPTNIFVQPPAKSIGRKVFAFKILCYLPRLFCTFNYGSLRLLHAGMMHCVKFMVFCLFFNLIKRCLSVLFVEVLDFSCEICQIAASGRHRVAQAQVFATRVCEGRARMTVHCL